MSSREASNNSKKKTGGYFVLGLECPTLCNKNIGAPKTIQNFGL